MAAEPNSAVLERELRALRERYPITARLELGLGLCTVLVESNSAKLVGLLGSYFRPFMGAATGPRVRLTALESPEPDLQLAFAAWPRDPGKVGGKDTFVDVGPMRVVRKVRTGMQFVLEPGAALAVGRCLTNANQVINLVNSRFMSVLLEDGFRLCHAAGVHHRGRGLALSGFSGAGKSTLALRLLERGADFVSNDRLLVRKRLGVAQMAGVPKMPRINPGTIVAEPRLWPLLSSERRSELRQMPRAELWALEEKYDADVAEFYGHERVRTASPLDTYVVLSWQPGSLGSLFVREGLLGDRPELFDAIVKHPGPFHGGALSPPPVQPLPDRGPYLAELGRVPYLELGGSVDFERAADLCWQRLV